MQFSLKKITTILTLVTFSMNFLLNFSPQNFSAAAAQPSSYASVNGQVSSGSIIDPQNTEILISGKEPVRTKRAYDGKFYVPKFDGMLSFSSDGTNWTHIQTPLVQKLLSVEANLNKIYAVTDKNETGNKLLISNDMGKNWHLESLPSQGSTADLVYNGKDFYLALGSKLYIGKENNNRLNWTIAATLPDNNASLNEICIYNSGNNNTAVMAVGTSGYTIFSANGTTNWLVEQLPQISSTNLNSVIAEKQGASYRFITCDKNSGSIYTKKPGYAWVKVSTSYKPTSIAVGDIPKKKYIGISGSKLHTSDDLINWVYYVDSVSGFIDIAYSNGQFAASGMGGTIFRTLNSGVTWEFSPTFYKDFTDIKWDGSKFVSTHYQEQESGIMMKHSGIFSSKDGVNWKGIPFNTDNLNNENFPRYLKTHKLGPSTFNNNISVVPGSPIEGKNVNSMIFYSTDFATFEKANVPATTMPLTNIIWDGSKFIAGGHSALILHSKDGINWTKGTSLPGVNLSSIIKGNDTYIAVGSKNNKGSILISQDGLNWNEILQTSDTTNIHHISYGNGRFVASGKDGYLCYSKDGYAWNRVVTTLNENFNQLSYSGRFILHGKSRVYTSFDGISWNTVNINHSKWNIKTISSDNDYTYIGCDEGLLIRIPNISFDKNYLLLNKFCKKDSSLSDRLYGSSNLPLNQTIKLAEPPKNGVVTVNPSGEYIYVPNNGFVGKDSFKWVIADDTILSSPTATVNINVSPIDIEITASQEEYHIKDWGKIIYPDWVNSFQNLIVEVSAQDPAFFAKSPMVDSRGYLTFALAPEKTGQTLVNITLRKNTETGSPLTILPNTTFKIQVMPENAEGAKLDANSFKNTLSARLAELPPSYSKEDALKTLAELCMLVKKAPNNNEVLNLLKLSLEKITASENDLHTNFDILIGLNALASAAVESMCTYELPGYFFKGEIGATLSNSQIQAIMQKEAGFKAAASRAAMTFMENKYHFSMPPVIKLNIKNSWNAERIFLETPYDLINFSENKSTQILFSSGLANMRFDADTFESKPDNLVLEVRKFGGDLLPSHFAESFRDSSILEVNVIGDNTPITKFKNPIKMSMPYTPSPNTDLNSLTVFHVNNLNLDNMRGFYSTFTKALHFTTDHMSIYFVKENKSKLNDVDSSWAKSYINSMAAKGIIKGDESMNFNPSDTVKRNEFAAMFINTFGLLDPTAVSSFNDVSPNAWFYKHVSSASSKGLMSGFPGNNFLPSNQILRKDASTVMANIFSKLKGYPKSVNLPASMRNYSDISNLEAYVRDSINLMISLDIMRGSPDADEQGKMEFQPNVPLNRAMTAVVLYKSLALYYSDGFLYYNGIASSGLDVS